MLNDYRIAKKFMENCKLYLNFMSHEVLSVQINPDSFSFGPINVSQKLNISLILFKSQIVATIKIDFFLEN
jgi:hypothetical protein